MDFMLGGLFGTLLGFIIAIIAVSFNEIQPVNKYREWKNNRNRLDMPNVRISYNGYVYMVEQQLHKEGKWESVWFPKRSGHSLIGGSVTTFTSREEALQEYTAHLKEVKKRYAKFKPITEGYNTPLWKTLNGENNEE